MQERLHLEALESKQCPIIADIQPGLHEGGVFPRSWPIYVHIKKCTTAPV